MNGQLPKVVIMTVEISGYELADKLMDFGAGNNLLYINVVI